MEACHDNMGHLGIERTTSLLKDRFYWPSMLQDVELHIRSCPRCLRFKTQPGKAELNLLITTRPMELVHIDYLTIEAPENSRSSTDINILVITDHFTRYAQAHITSSQKAHIVVKTLWEHFFVHYGFPEKILSDQGQNFESVLISELCELAQIKKLRTTLIDLRAMALVRGLIELLFPCLAPCQMISKVSGHITLALWFMPITVHAQMLHVSVHTTFFMVDNLCSPLILNMVSLLQNYLKLLLINMFRN